MSAAQYARSILARTTNTIGITMLVLSAWSATAAAAVVVVGAPDVIFMYISTLLTKLRAPTW
jgi:hypothetical protein